MCVGNLFCLNIKNVERRPFYSRVQILRHNSVSQTLLIQYIKIKTIYGAPCKQTIQCNFMQLSPTCNPFKTIKGEKKERAKPADKIFGMGCKLPKLKPFMFSLKIRVLTSYKQLKSSLFIIAYSNTHNKFNLLSHAKK